MRYGIFSDVHSNLEALNAVLTAYKNESINKYICVGDVVGYATNPAECIDIVKSLCAVTIAGNHDWACVGLFSPEYFNAEAKEAIFWTKRNISGENSAFLESLKLVYKNEDFTMVHGVLKDPQDFNYTTDGYAAWETFNLMDMDICFIGHTHAPGFFIKEDTDAVSYRQDSSLIIEKGNKYIINVGSVGQPRDGDPHSTYCIYDTEAKKIEIKRAGYDTRAVRDKIYAAGLPKYLGDRLILGR